MKKLLAFLLLVSLIIIVSFGFWNSQLVAVSPADKSGKTIIIPKGQSFSQTTDQLYKEGLIKSPLVFKIYAKLQGFSGKIRAGTFKLSPSQPSQDILLVLSNQPLEIWLTFLEGWRIEEEAAELNSKFQIPKDKFLEIAKEGYMFPDTYLFPKDIAASKIVKILKDNFDDKFNDDLRAKVKTMGLTQAQAVILASIIEREARSDEARKMVASILLKRLDMGMALQADATVQYALGYQPQQKSWWKKGLTKDDLRVDSPYNTYLNAGLPPAPICNPGLSSLKAVANADSSTPYLYYYHDSQGNPHYAKTLEEHNANIAKYP